MNRKTPWPAKLAASAAGTERSSSASSAGRVLCEGRVVVRKRFRKYWVRKDTGGSLVVPRPQKRPGGSGRRSVIADTLGTPGRPKLARDFEKTRPAPVPPPPSYPR